MGKTKKPRKAYRPGKVIIPPAFGTTADMDMRLGMRMRQAVDAVIGGSGTWDDLMGCESELIVSIKLCAIAVQQPDAHEVEASALHALDDRLCAIAAAVYAIKQRERETGRVGCSGDQRLALLELADIVDETRRALPRRLWLLAYRAAYDVPKVVVRPVEATA